MDASQQLAVIRYGILRTAKIKNNVKYQAHIQLTKTHNSVTICLDGRISVTCSHIRCNIRTAKVKIANTCN